MIQNKVPFKAWFLRDFVLEGMADMYISSGQLYHLPLNLLVGYLIKHLIEKSKKTISKPKIKQILNNLEKREIIDLVEVDDKVFVQINEKGKPLVLRYSIKELLDLKRKKKKWNGKWFLVFFDVPELQRNKRDILRRFLLKIGFYRYQKSVYLFPYECEKEVVLIKKIVEGAKYMKYIVADKIEDEEQAKIYFGI